MKKGLITMVMAMSSAAGAGSCARGNAAGTAPSAQGKTLVAFFSRADENYGVGRISKGNTHIVADMIAARTGGKLFHIETETPYPEGYDDCTAVAKREKQGNEHPKLKAEQSADGFDVVFIGFPNWWGDMPMAVYTWIEQQQWEGKTVIPFCTHEGSGMGGMDKKLAKACKGASMKEGFAVTGTMAQRSQKETKARADKWLGRLGY